MFNVSFFYAVGNFQIKNVNVTTIIFFMSGDLTGLCLYMVFRKGGISIVQVYSGNKADT